MADLLRWLAIQGGELIALVIPVAIFAGAVWAGVATARFKGKVAGWIVGVASFLLLSFLLYPAAEDIRRANCVRAGAHPLCFEDP